jgi:hypothetical protein
VIKYFLEGDCTFPQFHKGNSIGAMLGDRTQPGVKFPKRAQKPVEYAVGVEKALAAAKKRGV